MSYPSIHKAELKLLSVTKAAIEKGVGNLVPRKEDRTWGRGCSGCPKIKHAMSGEEKTFATIKGS